MQALERLQSKLASGEAMLIYEDCVIHWLTGFSTDFGVVGITKNNAFFITDGRYSEAASRVVTNMKIFSTTQLTGEANLQFAKENVHTIYLEQKHTTLFQLDTRRAILSHYELITNNQLDFWITQERAKKTPEEIHNLKLAQQLTDDGFSYILNHIAAGKTEKEIALDLEFYMRKQGADATAFDFVVVSGKNTSLPHGVPSDKPLENGDFVTLDFGAVVKGMHSDMTRTVAIGSVSEKQQKVYDIVLKAQETCLKCLRAGLPCVYADKLARDAIEKFGYGTYFSHSTGHGVGFAIHEAPTLSPKSQDGDLQVGNVVTVEPGIYIPGEFGVRIEDMAYILPEGIENLTKSKKTLLVL
ncbi:MAG: aminopeptidase P family protein [Clostridia bacterium]|nr:aminopeptidase P family protein [Clostridia bacterium]